MLGLLLSFCVAEPAFPRYPKKYTLKGTWQIPYWQIRQQIRVVADFTNGRLAEIAYNGLQKSLHFLGQNTVSMQVGTVDGQSMQYCRNSTVKVPADDKLTEYLPTDYDNWVYKGVRVLLGKNCNVWRKVITDEAGQQINDYFYEFYADADTDAPVRYHQHGNNLKGGHPTDYYFDVEEWGMTIDDFEFLYPADCSNGGAPVGPQFGLSSALRRTPPSPLYKFEIQTQETCDVVTELPDVTLPSGDFTWRDVPGAVPKVRDQALCGSCWAQAATEAASAQIGIMTGKQVTVSAQQMVDCAWSSLKESNGTFINQACDGGEGWEGYGKMFNMPLVSEEVYPYMGSGGYCAPNYAETLGAKIVGCKQIAEDREKDPQHSLLKKALYKYGPLMISIRAGFVPFTTLNATHPFFSDAEHCDVSTWETNLVDHGVLLTGWKTHEGKEYFEIMNSWSDFWGLEGFGYIDEQYDCGIETMVLVPQIQLD